MASRSTECGVSKLSSDLLLQTLAHLPVPDLLKCRELTRDFRAFIDESCSLQYGVELVLAGSEDDGSSGLTASEKRRQLRRYKALRDTLHPMLLSRNKVQFRGDEKSWDMQTGSLVLMRQGNLEFTQFASATRNTPKRVWELWLDWQDFIALDPRQDLLITFQLQQGRFRVRILSMSTGTRHPSAHNSEFYIPAPPGADIDHLHLEYSVFETKVTVLCTYTDHELGRYYEVLCVANWRTGYVLLSRNNQHITAFCLLDANRILIATAPPELRAIRLSIVDFTSHYEEPTHLLLPEFSDRVSWYSAAIGSNCQRSATSPGRLTLPFHASQTDRIFVIEFSINYEDENLQRTLILPSWCLERALVQSTSIPYLHTDVPWEEWGPRNTRLMTERPSTSEGQTADSSATGMRYVTIESGFAVVNDFNRFALRHTSDSELMENPLVKIVSGSSIADLPFFKRPITTSVPYRRIVTSLPVSATQRVGVAEDYLVVIEDDSWSLEMLCL